MPDIMQQLEEGKKIQEENGIDINSLRTKINSEEEKDKTEKQKSKRGRKKKEQLKDNKHQDNESIPEDPFVQAEKIMNESEEKDSDSKKQEDNKEKKPEKYPGFDFNNYYEKGQKIFYIRLIEKLGIKEFLELKIRTIYPKMIIACEEKKSTHCIGPDTQDMIFTDRYSAVEAYNNIKIKSYKDVNVKDELGDTEVEDMED